MSEASSSRTRLAAVVGAVVVLLVVFVPVLLLGQSVSSFGLILIGAGLVGVGLVARARHDQSARMFGTIVTVMGALIFAAAVGLLVLLLGGLGRGI